MLFLSAVAAAPKPNVTIWGLPYDGDVSFRAGAALAPNAIREFSDSIEEYSPRSRRELGELVIVDIGDHVGGLDQIEVPLESGLLVTFGGDHAITPPVVEAFHGRYPDLAVVGFDAHLDMRVEYHGEHACTHRRIADAGIPNYLFGLRSGEKQEWEDAARLLASASPDLYIAPAVRSQLADRPIYVTIDIDVLDPAVAPGTGTPEAGGFRFNELLETLESLESLNVVAFDIVEVSPPLDPSGITLGAAAILTRELILRWA